MEDIEQDIDNKIKFHRKSFSILIVLLILGIITGLIVSNYYFVDANGDIREWNQRIDDWNDGWQNWSHWNNSYNNTGENNSWYNQSWNNESSNNNTISENSSFSMSEYDPYLKILSYDDVILPSVACVLLCIVSYILLALNITYIKIYIESKSKYIQGLLFVLIPWLIFSSFLIRVVKSLYFASALKFSYINVIFGFDISGLGTMLIILTIFEIIGFSVLFLKSTE
jgi:hypothetical protein